MAFSRLDPLKLFKRSVSVVSLILALTSVCVAQDARTKVESEPFPQSAKIARDRQVDAVVEAARVQIAKREYAAAIAALLNNIPSKTSTIDHKGSVCRLIMVAAAAKEASMVRS